MYKDEGLGEIVLMAKEFKAGLLIPGQNPVPRIRNQDYLCRLHEKIDFIPGPAHPSKIPATGKWFWFKSFGCILARLGGYLPDLQYQLSHIPSIRPY